MKKRHLYVLLFSVPIVLASAVIAFVVFGAAAGAFWLFVFGDRAWPPAATVGLAALFLLVFAASAFALTCRAYALGRAQEAQASLDARHVLAAAGAAAFLLLVIVAYQWHVGNIGRKTEESFCSEFCEGKGFAGSGTPPRNAGAATCSCFDAQGREAVKVPMESVLSHK